MYLPSLRSWVRIPRTPSTLFPFIVKFVLHVFAFALNENKKRPCFAHLNTRIDESLIGRRLKKDLSLFFVGAPG